MLKFRKVVVWFLSVVLLVSLIGTALATSANHTLGKPKKVEAMLSQSKLYDHFVAYATDQAKKSAGDSDQSDSVSLSDAAVQSFAKSAFSSQLIEQNVNTFLDSNYAWLEGKTATPDFRIDLSSAKDSFAQKVGHYVKIRTAGLPICTNAELAQLQQQQSVDYLAATCRPPALTPEAAGAQVTEELRTSGDFLSNPVITASTINPEANPQSKPYYEKLAHLPKAYRIGTKLPYILGGLSLVSALCIVSIAPVRRKGVRRVGIMLLVSGIVLVALKFVADFGFNKLEHRIFNSSDVGQLQQSLSNFAHRVESSLVKTDLLFGIAFLLLALIILGILFRTRQKDDKPPAVVTGETAPTEAGQPPIVISRSKRRQPAVDNIKPGTAPEGGTGEPAAAAPAVKPKNRRRLIQ